MMLTAAHFLLSEWLWGMTYDLYHIPLNIIMMIIVLKLFFNISVIRAVSMAALSQIFAFTVLSICSFGSMYFIGAGGGPDSFTVVPGPLYATLFLGLIYAVLQIVFFTFSQSRHNMPFSALLVTVIMSNSLTLLITWLLFNVEHI